VEGGDFIITLFTLVPSPNLTSTNEGMSRTQAEHVGPVLTPAPYSPPLQLSSGVKSEVPARL
jgi:hypothetical protein